MLKHGDNGLFVKDLQTRLVTLGYALPRWGADGDLGDETLGAFARFFAEHTHGSVAAALAVMDGKIDTAQHDLLARVHDSVTAIGPDPLWLFDMCRVATAEHVYGFRSWPTVTEIVLHQTACELGQKPERYLAIGAHYVVQRADRALRMHAETALIGHSGQNKPPHNGFNTNSVGIEFDGLFAGVEGDERTVWNNPSTARKETAIPPTKHQLERGIELVARICDRVRAHGGQVRRILAHRQASSSRPNDPGSAIWQGVALPAIKSLKLSDGGPGYKVGYGSPIPEAWDPSRKGIAY